MFTLKNFYKSKEWKKLIQILKLERVNEEGKLICEHCGKELIKAYDIIGHHKTELTPNNVNDLNISLNPENIALIHFKCHNEIHNRFGYEQQKVYIVYGSPLSGKSTWVKENSTPEDLVVDIDNIYNMLNMNSTKYIKSNRLKTNAFLLRDSLIEQIKMRTGKWRNAYIIGGYPLLMERMRLSETLGAECIYIESTKEECLNRLYVAQDRAEVIKEWEKYIDDWWSRYQAEEEA